MGPIRFVSLVVALTSRAALAAPPSLLLVGSPDAPATRVTPDAAVVEDWGTIALNVVDPAPLTAADPILVPAPYPTVVRRIAGHSWSAELKIWRAPTWPTEADIIQLLLTNNSSQPLKLRLRLTVPETMAMGERVGVAGGRTVLVLPSQALPIRNKRKWGCTGEAIPMPGWAHPAEPCDPAFANIRAGMGGVPITYFFAVPPGAPRTVALGLCESYWSAPGSRPLRLSVEGAPPATVDPLQQWGRDKPGALIFAARDVDADGWLKIVVTTTDESPDKNPILNVIWVFPPGFTASVGDIVSGRFNEAADYYVDVGGRRDQLLYQPGPVDFTLALPPRTSHDFALALAPASASLPPTMWQKWSIAALQHAARKVWRPWLDPLPRSVPPSALPECFRAVAIIALTRAQDNGFYAVLPKPGSLADYSHAQAELILALLDACGLYQQAEQSLRFLWDPRAPASFKLLLPGPDSLYRDPTADPTAHAHALAALCRHALLSGDLTWTHAAWPAISRAAKAAMRPPQSSSPDVARAFAVALLGAARVASLLRDSHAQAFRAAARALSPNATWQTLPAVTPHGPVALAAAQVLSSLGRHRSH